MRCVVRSPNTNVHAVLRHFGDGRDVPRLSHLRTKRIQILAAFVPPMRR